MSNIAQQNPLMAPVIFNSQVYFTSQYFHRMYHANKPEGGKYSRLSDFNRLIRGIEAYQNYVERGDIVELEYYTLADANIALVKDLFKAVSYKPIMLINATAQVALTHHLDDEISKNISVAVNSNAAKEQAILSKDHVDANRLFKSNLSVAKLIFKGNQALLSANQATLKATGINVLENLDASHLISEKKEVLLTPSDIGKQIGLTANKVNILLENKKFQQGYRDAKGRQCWKLTSRGESYAELLDTGKKHGNGTPVKQIKWRESIVSFLYGSNI